jgi:hypothetical protein
LLMQNSIGHLGGIRHYRTTNEFFSTRHYTDLVQPLGLRQKTCHSQDIPFGLGWVIDVRNGRKKVWHLGGGQGVSTILCMRSEHGVAVPLLLNLGGLSTPTATAPTLDLARRIAGLVSSAP